MSVLSGYQLCRRQRVRHHRRTVGGARDIETSSNFDRREKAVLRFAEALTRTPAEVSDALFEDIRELFSTEQIVELTAAAALENYRARFNCAFKIESDGLCMLPPIIRCASHSSAIDSVLDTLPLPTARGIMVCSYIRRIAEESQRSEDAGRFTSPSGKRSQRNLPGSGAGGRGPQLFIRRAEGAHRRQLLDRARRGIRLPRVPMAAARPRCSGFFRR